MAELHSIDNIVKCGDFYCYALDFLFSRSKKYMLLTIRDVTIKLE